MIKSGHPNVSDQKLTQSFQLLSTLDKMYMSLSLSWI